jgi:hypothetical protein
MELRKSAIALRESVKLLERAEEAEAGKDPGSARRRAERNLTNRSRRGTPAHG